MEVAGMMAPFSISTAFSISVCTFINARNYLGKRERKALIKESLVFSSTTKTFLGPRVCSN